MNKIYSFLIVIIVGLTILYTNEIKKENTNLSDELTNIKSIEHNAKRILKNNEKRNEIKNNKLKVKVLNSCSIKSTLCGTFAFGSVSTILILEGKFANETIIVPLTSPKMAPPASVKMIAPGIERAVANI